MSGGPAWCDANQRRLVASLARVGGALDRHAARRADGVGRSEASDAVVDDIPELVAEPAALDVLSDAFGLSPFERDVLLLCAGVELDASFGPRCAAASGDARRPWPTFGLALAALPDPHWSALSPEAPLRCFRLIEVEVGEGLTQARLRIDERVLHYLTGLSVGDPRLRGIIEPAPPFAISELPASHAAIARRIAAVWSQHAHPDRPIVQVHGGDARGRSAIVAAACAEPGAALSVLNAANVPASPNERDSLARLWGREAVLLASVLLVECDDGEGAETVRAAVAFAERAPGIALLSARHPVPARARATVHIEVPRASPQEQRMLWQSALGPTAGPPDGALSALVAEVVEQFNLSPSAVRAVAAEVLGQCAGGATPLGALLWEGCRTQARPRLDALAHRIEADAGWDDLVLPPGVARTLRDLAAQVRHRSTVYGRWGFASTGARGLGITALFAGASGTGKSMAAEVIARELRLDLYRVDLSQVVSKYIGETEKNLCRIFDAADESGAILFFDEADALFGKRSEVKDSHDRYANLEVSYLLQRMEAYRGLAVLTTNLRGALDSAFVRRLRFIVEFPFPDAGEREEIWRRAFPSATPTEGLDLKRLSRLHVPGGVIRNIALNAAFVAAEASEVVRMSHVLHAVRAEYEKMERPLSDADMGDAWAAGTRLTQR